MNSAIWTCLYMSFWYMCLYIYVRNIFRSEFCLFHRTIYSYIYDTAVYLSNVFVPIYTLPSNVREFQFQHLVLSTFYFILAAQCGMWDLRSSTRDQTCASAVEMPSPNHWAIKWSFKCHFLSWKTFEKGCWETWRNRGPQTSQAKAQTGCCWLYLGRLSQLSTLHSAGCLPPRLEPSLLFWGKRRCRLNPMWSSVVLETAAGFWSWSLSMGPFPGLS